MTTRYYYIAFYTILLMGILIGILLQRVIAQGW